MKIIYKIKYYITNCISFMIYNIRAIISKFTFDKPVGTIIKYKKKRNFLIEENINRNKCIKCAFYNQDCFKIVKHCMPFSRKDKKFVIIKEIK